MSRQLRCILVALLALNLTLPAVASAQATEEPEQQGPEPTPARAGLPGSVAVLGDSISAGTGANGGGQGGWPGQERPRNSWATGDYPGLESVHQRIDALGDDVSVAFNLSENGRRAQHVLGQVQASPEDVDYILVQIGGNDLCRPTVDEMTPTAEYRAHIDETLAWIAEHRPDALVQINAVPDIYRLWEIRRTNFVAVLFWASGLIPCQSLLASPTSTSSTNMARRAQVRERGLEYNAELREACAQYLRCRYDDDATWLFSNDPTRFVNGDISTQDHFHPSFQGQQKLAGVSWEAGFDFTDAAPPQITYEPSPEPTEAGWHAGDVEVAVSATDEAEVAGMEVRVHRDGSVGGWQAVFGAQTTVAVDAEGVSHLEARAIDVNGNVSESVLQTVSIDRTAPTIALQAPEDGSQVVLGGELTLAFTCDDDRSGVASCSGTQEAGAALDTTSVGEQTVTLEAVDHAGNVTRQLVTYRVVYAVGADADRVDGDAPITINRNAQLPVRLTVADVAGVVVPDLEPELVLQAADGDPVAAGPLTYDPVQDRYTAQLHLRRLSVQPGAHDLIVALDDGTERVVASLLVR